MDQRAIDSTAVMASVFQNAGGLKITAEARLLYLALFSHTGADRRCHPSISELARSTALTRNTVQHHLEELEAAGLLERQPGPGRSTDYTLFPPWGPKKGGG